MNTIKRKSFLKMGALAMLAPLLIGFVLRRPAIKKYFLDKDDDILKKMVVANDKQVAELLQTITEGNIVFSRKIGYDFANLAAAYVTWIRSIITASLIIPKLKYYPRH